LTILFFISLLEAKNPQAETLNELWLKLTQSTSSLYPTEVCEILIDACTFKQHILKNKYYLSDSTKRRVLTFKKALPRKLI
jgi:hypothetical protein